MQRATRRCKISRAWAARWTCCSSRTPRATRELVVLELRRYGFDVAFERVETGPALSGAFDGPVAGTSSSATTACPGSTAEALRDRPRDDRRQPFVILSGTIGEEAAVEALRAGARDFVLKRTSRASGRSSTASSWRPNRRRQREAEAALRESEARKSAILDSALDAVIAIDHEGADRLQPRGGARFRVRARRVVGRCGELSSRRRCAGTTRAAFARHRRRGESTIIGRARRAHRDARRRRRVSGRAPITRGELFGRPFFTGYIRDITERSRAEEERASSRRSSGRRRRWKRSAASPAASRTTSTTSSRVVIGYSGSSLRGSPTDDPSRRRSSEIARARREGRRAHAPAARVQPPPVLEPRVLDLNEVVADSSAAPAPDRRRHRARHAPRARARARSRPTRASSSR